MFSFFTYWPCDISQLSFAASAAVLADRERYPNLFCTVPSDATVSRSVVRILSQYRWSRVGVLTDGQHILEVNTETTPLMISLKDLLKKSFK